MKSWDTLSKGDKNKIAYEWIQAEGYDDHGNEYATVQDYYNAVYLPSPHLTSEHEASIIACEQGQIAGAN